MSAPSIEAAEAMGATGSPAVEAERLAFEAWVRGHCWGIDAAWNGSDYTGQGSMLMRPLWAAWRDRAALAQPATKFEQKPNEFSHLLTQDALRSMYVTDDPQPATVAQPWRPIETAPRDGRRVLVWIADEVHTGHAFAKLWWHEDGRIGGGAEGFNGDWRITHWMPLPDAPGST